MRDNLLHEVCLLFISKQYTIRVQDTNGCVGSGKFATMF